MGPASANRKKTGLLLLSASLVISALAYVQTLSYDFVYDDKPLIVDNPVIKDARNIPRILLREDIIDHVHAGYYRPLSPLPHMLDYYIWGLNPLGFHLSNIIYHLAAVSLVFLLCLMISGSSYAAFAASLFFGIHPVNTEPVAFITGRNNVLCGVFTLACLAAYMKYRQGGKRRLSLFLPAYTALFLAGLCFKEFAIMLPVFIIAADVMQGRSVRKRIFTWDYLPFFAAIAIYLAMRSYVLKGAVGTPLKLNELPLRMLSMPEVLITYLRLSFIPLWQKAQYNIGLNASAGKWAYALLLAALLLALFRYRKKRAVSLAALWFFLFLAPVMNIVPVSGSLMAERYLYVPLAGIAVSIGTAFGRAVEGKRRNPAIGLFVFYACALFFLTVQRNPVWRNDESLYTDMIKTEPSAYKGWYNLGNMMYREGRLKEAQMLWEKALAVKPGMYAVHNNLGVLYEKTGDYALAEKHYRIILAVKPYPEVYQNLGNALSGEKKFAQAEDAYKRAIGMDRDSLRGYVLLSDFYSRTGRPALALGTMEQAVKNMPASCDAYNILGTVAGKMGRYDEARSAFLRAIALDPGCKACFHNLNVLKRLKKPGA
ncbi:MAG: tetratricopeptide repeat protein [Nitrospiraceae bacterium]|nr:tetratricopeptide repeat protein [Nitrospiraceae bacterium]